MVMGNFIFGGGASPRGWVTGCGRRKVCRTASARSSAAESLDRRASITHVRDLQSREPVESRNRDRRRTRTLLLKKGVTADELAQAKKGYLQQQEVGRASDGHLATILADTLYAGRTMQYYVDLEKKIKAQTPETVLKAVDKYIDPQRLVIVVAGDFDAKPAGDTAAATEK